MNKRKSGTAENRRRTIRPFTLASLNHVISTAPWIDTDRLGEDGILNPYHHKTEGSICMAHSAFLQLFLPEDFLDQPLSDDGTATFRSVYLSHVSIRGGNGGTSGSGTPQDRSVYLSSLMNGARSNSRGWERCRGLLIRIGAAGGRLGQDGLPFVLELENAAASFLGTYVGTDSSRRSGASPDIRDVLRRWKAASPESEDYLRDNPGAASLFRQLYQTAARNPALALGGCLLLAMLSGIGSDTSLFTCWNRLFRQARQKLDLPGMAERLFHENLSQWCQQYDGGASGRFYDQRLFPDLSDGQEQFRADAYDAAQEAAPLVFLTGGAGSGRKTLLRYYYVQSCRQGDDTLNVSLPALSIPGTVQTENALPEEESDAAKGRIAAALSSVLAEDPDKAMALDTFLTSPGRKRLYLFLADPSGSDCRELGVLMRNGVQIFCGVPSASTLPGLFFRGRARFLALQPYSDARREEILQGHGTQSPELSSPLMMHLYLEGSMETGERLLRRDLLLGYFRRIWKEEAGPVLWNGDIPACYVLQDEELFLLYAGFCAAWCYEHHTLEAEETILASASDTQPLFSGRCSSPQDAGAAPTANLAACIRILVGAGVLSRIGSTIRFAEIYWRDFLAGYYYYRGTEQAILTGACPEEGASYLEQGGRDYYSFFTADRLRYYEERLEAQEMESPWTGTARSAKQSGKVVTDESLAGTGRGGRYVYDTLVCDLLYYGNGADLPARADLKTEEERNARRQQIISLSRRYAAEYGPLCYDCAVHLHHAGLDLLKGKWRPAQVRRAAAYYRQAWTVLQQYVDYCHTQNRIPYGGVDLLRAALLYETASAEPFPPAYREQTGIQEDPQKVVVWLREGEAGGDEYCTLSLAELYEAGRIHEGRLIIPDSQPEVPGPHRKGTAADGTESGRSDTATSVPCTGMPQGEASSLPAVSYPVRDGRFPQREIPAYRDYCQAYRLYMTAARQDGSLQGAGRAALLLMLCYDSIGDEPLPVVSVHYLTVGELQDDAVRAACAERYLRRFFDLGTYLQSSDSWKPAYLDILMALGLAMCLQNRFQEAIGYLSSGYRLAKRYKPGWTRYQIRFYALWKCTLQQMHAAAKPAGTGSEAEMEDMLPAELPAAPWEIREMIAQDNGSAVLNRIYQETLQ